MNATFVAVMLALMCANIFVIWLSNYYGYHQYHFYVEYSQRIIPADIDDLDFKGKWASGFINLKNADFSEGHEHVIDLINQLVLANCGNCTVYTKELQIKSLTKLD